MQLSTRARYAVMAMVELAGRAGPVTLAEIADCQQLSHCYLEQLFAALRRSGLVIAARGPGGGYRLARPAEAVSIADIAVAVAESTRVTRCGDSGGCLADAEGGRMRCRTHDLWAELGRQIELFLAGVSLADVVRGAVAGRAVPPLRAVQA